MERINLKDIADALGISQSSVSRALRNKPGVSSKLREKIFKMAQSLNYPFIPPKSQVYKRMGIIIPDYSNPFFATVCYGIESVLRSNGYFTYLVNTDEDWELESDYVHSLVDDGFVEGLIIAPSANTEKLYRQYVGVVPFIFFDRHYESLDVQSVLVDNKDVVFQALKYLAALGHKEICLIGGNQDLYTGRARTAGFLEGLDLLGLDRRKCHVVDAKFREPDAYTAVKELLARENCSALISSSNKTTWGILGALADLGFRIPKDISVIGFDHQEWMEFSTPQLTTVVQPAFTMGTLAASLLLQQINGNPSTDNVVLKAHIKKRESVQKIC